MTTPPPTSGHAFDAYADSYDDALQQGLSASGEDKEYFARKRVEWLAGRLRTLSERPRSVLDFGCGTGLGSQLLVETLGTERGVAVDTSERSIETATRERSSERLRFLTRDAYKPAQEIDLAFCNGVFHHVPVDQRALQLKYIHDALRPGGILAFWENNPWNPGTRYVMSRIPFDRDAITIPPPEARFLLRQQKFSILRTDFLFIFPRLLSWLRWVEPVVAMAPLGGQYMVLCRKQHT